MFTLTKNELFATPQSQDELNEMLGNLGDKGVLGAMFMYNFISDQYKKGNVILEEDNGIQP